MEQLQLVTEVDTKCHVIQCNRYNIWDGDDTVPKLNVLGTVQVVEDQM